MTPARLDRLDRLKPRRLLASIGEAVGNRAPDVDLDDGAPAFLDADGRLVVELGDGDDVVGLDRAGDRLVLSIFDGETGRTHRADLARDAVAEIVVRLGGGRDAFADTLAEGDFAGLISVRGGDGSDRLVSTAPHARLFGDNGIDDPYAAGREARLDGGAGGDFLTGGDGP